MHGWMDGWVGGWMDLGAVVLMGRSKDIGQN